ncbi:acetate/propionate family kinase [Antarctobacter heliothermus]|uniref:Acetate kinase n=1 Tax=Antarctobacter heliothermus TaxID=74033 RepID=A0A239E2T0_9RHOB|nr:acetate/propionate family kinase [Antarctobacter heliothermus]SNS39040.1 acetate kinase [Antarctobacter heliothermus]
MIDPTGGDVLVLNVGSSSIKCAVFDSSLREVLRGGVEGLGPRARLQLGAARRDVDAPDHRGGLAALLEALEAQGVALNRLRVVGHRVVHGGPGLTQPAHITPQVRAEIARCTPLAPLHNPHHLAAMDALATLVPDLPQVACFDTGFHATNPQVALRYALPADLAEAGLRRYGFHGLSYGGVVRRLTALAGALPGRVLAFHLGNGASACAIRDGQSVATTMGYSPTDGLTMGTRSGSIDPNVVLRLAEERGIDGARHLLTHGAGLAGLSGGVSDMRALEARDDPASRFAIDHFIYWAQRHAGSLIAAMQGLDAVVFTGGIGENSAMIRAGILDGLTWAGARYDPDRNRRNAPRLHAKDAEVSVWVLPAEEEYMIAQAARDLLATV